MYTPEPADDQALTEQQGPVSCMCVLNTISMFLLLLGY